MPCVHLSFPRTNEVPKEEKCQVFEVVDSEEDDPTLPAGDDADTLPHDGIEGLDMSNFGSNNFDDLEESPSGKAVPRKYDM